MIPLLSGDTVTRQVTTSCTQDRRWFLDRLAPSPAAAHVFRAYRVEGVLDVAALAEAWRAVVRRHDILRAVLVEVAGRPVQDIPADAAPSSFADLGAAPGPDPAQAAQRLCDEHAAAPLTAGDGPGARLAVARTGTAEHVLLLTLHRAVSDEDSVPILLDELSRAYAVAAGGGSADAALPGPAPQYADYARWQRRQVRATPQRDLLDWWKAALTPAPALPSLPVDRDVPAGVGGVVTFDWGVDLGRRLTAFCEAEKVTPGVALLTTVQALLGRYTGADRVAVGVPVSVRPPAAGRMVGPFDNPLVLGADLSGWPTFRELLARVADQVAAAAERRAVPFDHVVAALGAERVAGRSPLFDVTLDVAAAPEPVPALPGAVVRRLPVTVGGAGAELAFTVGRSGPGLTGTLEFRADRLDASSAGRIAEQARTLLTAALQRPHLPLADLPLEDITELRERVAAADLIPAAAPAGAPVHELVRRTALRRPESPAVDWAGETLSYQDLLDRAASVATALRANGVPAGAAVAVRVPTGPARLAALIGAWQAGAHVVCLGTGDVGERGRKVLTDLRPAGLVVDPAADDDDLAGWYRRELGGAVVDPAAAAPAGPAPEIAAPAPPGWAYVAYTSGSTGNPKGIPQTHDSFAQFVTWFAGEFGIRPGARVAQWAAAGYDASLCEAFATLVAGATVCPVPDRLRANPERLVDWLVAERITHFQTVPSFARALLRVIEQRGPAGAPAELTHVLLAGEPLPGELAGGIRAALPGVRLVNLYGPTESILATWHEITGPVHGVAPIGRPIPARQVLVLDDKDRPCPAGVTGHLVIRSPHLTPGYVGAAAGDRSAFAPLRDRSEYGLPAGDCYRTGDLGRLRWDGALEFRGRRDAQVKVLGARMELGEIETVLGAHESVALCAVIAVRNAHGLVSRLVAHVVPRRPEADSTALTGLWRTHLRRTFGGSLPPLTYRIARDLPRNAGGKVDRTRLATAEPAGRASAGSALNAAERRMAAVWAELVGMRRLTPDDTFFAAGGTSATLLELLHRVRDRLGVHLSLRDCYENPSLSGMAALAAVPDHPREATS